MTSLFQPDGRSVGASPDRPNGFMSREECKALFDRCVALASGGGEVFVNVDSIWTGSVDWARNRAYISQDVHQATLRIMRLRRGAAGIVTTTQLDDAGLQAALRLAERGMKEIVKPSNLQYDTRPHREPVSPPLLQPKLWSEATRAFDSEHRGEAVRQLIAPVEAAGFVAAGDLRVRGRGQAVFNTFGTERYYPTTRVVFSTTVRDTKGTGSGWAGVDDFDVTRVNMVELAQRAFTKSRMSVNPVALEPGRYTTILEPQAVADLWASFMLIGVTMDRSRAEERLPEGAPPELPFSKGDGFSKIGEKVINERLTLSADPMDPVGGFLPFRDDGTPYRPVTWIDKGMLREMSYEYFYALGALGLETGGLPNSSSWRLGGGSASIEDMIASTDRGVLVTRFNNVEPFHIPSFSCTGYTRDGLWLIEKGKISKPVKNFRFTESPLFAFGRVEQVGVPRRVFSEAAAEGADLAWIAPALKVQDFNFTQIADAV